LDLYVIYELKNNLEIKLVKIVFIFTEI
jgi:hypothetical protein